MIPSSHALFLQVYRWAILIVVGVLGVLISFWVNKSLTDVERDRLEQRFQMAARARADAVIGQMQQPLEHLSTLQRLFGSVDRVDWTAYKKFAQPMLSQPGVRSFMWFPRVDAVDRPAFEQEGKNLWGESFSVVEFGFDGQAMWAADHPLYFPLLYMVPEERGRKLAGKNLYGIPSRAKLIDQAIHSRLPTSNDIGALLMEPSIADATFLIAPVYRNGVTPLTREERRIEATGLVVAALNVGDLFTAAAGSLPEIGVHVRLLDIYQTQGKQRIAAWDSRLISADRWLGDVPPTYSEDFELASHIWTVQVEAA